MPSLILHVRELPLGQTLGYFRAIARLGSHAQTWYLSLEKCLSVRKPTGTPENLWFAFPSQRDLPAAGTGQLCYVCDINTHVWHVCPEPPVLGTSPIRADLTGLFQPKWFCDSMIPICSAAATPGKEPTHNFSSPKLNLYPSLKHWCIIPQTDGQGEFRWGFQIHRARKIRWKRLNAGKCWTIPCSGIPGALHKLVLSLEVFNTTSCFIFLLPRLVFTNKYAAGYIQNSR